MVQGGDQHIRIGGGKELLDARARGLRAGQPSRLGRLDADTASVTPKHSSGGTLSSLHAREEHLRMRLPLREVAARCIGVEDSTRVSPGFTRSDSRPFSSGDRVVQAGSGAGRGPHCWRRRPRRRHRIPASLYRDDEAQRVRVAR